MKLESLAYSLFGNNLVIGEPIVKQLAFLKEIVPHHWLHREMDDLGCGDGKVTVLWSSEREAGASTPESAIWRRICQRENWLSCGASCIISRTPGHACIS
jgi:hypothetical protein